MRSLPGLGWEAGNVPCVERSQCPKRGRTKISKAGESSMKFKGVFERIVTNEIKELLERVSKDFSRHDPDVET